MANLGSGVWLAPRKDEPETRGFAVSIRTALLVLLVGEIAVMVTLASWLWYRNGERAVQSVERKLREELTTRVKQHIDDLMVQPIRVNEINYQAYEMGALDLKDVSRLEEYLWRQLRTFPEVAYIDVGTATGDFIGLERLSDGTFTVEICSHKTGRALQTSVLGPNRERLARREQPGYVVQQRPWYARAVQVGEPTWTGIYPFFALPPRLGITAVRPLRDAKGQIIGVLGCDLVLQNLSGFLRTIEVGKTGHAFIIEPDGALVASSGESPPFIQDETEVERISVVDYDDPLIQAAGTALVRAYGDDLASIHGPVQLAGEHDGEEILIQIVPVSRELGIDWLAVTVVPASDYLAEVREGTSFTLGLFLLLLVGAGVTIALTARKISGSIQAVSVKMEEIADFQVGIYDLKPSAFREIRAMQSSLGAMEQAIQSFGKYAPLGVVRRLVRAGREAVLGVEAADVSILFTDIVGFTAIAESISPEVLVATMDEYMGEMTRLIEATGGTVDKYIGDEIMAFWNAPQPVQHHAKAAVHAAMSCQRRLGEINVLWAMKGLPLLGARIGVHTGRVLVGNLGSKERMSYTILGDTVNLASRLEGLNKLYGTNILVSDTTMAAIEDEYLCRPLDRVTVKGKSQSTTVYEVVGVREELSKQVRERVARLTEAFEAYTARDFAQALGLFEAALEGLPSDRGAALLRDRCVELLKNPPPEDWDGVYAVTEK